MIEASIVVHLTRELTGFSADWCIVGGWGVDALLREQTRPHKDLDVFVERKHLPVVLGVLQGAGFRHAYAWEENRVLAPNGPCPGDDSAFVMADDEGGEVDIHVYAVNAGRVEVMWETDHTFRPDDLAAPGVIAGLTVRCMTPEKQLETHVGYELPEAHRHDVGQLQILLAGA